MGPTTCQSQKHTPNKAYISALIKLKPLTQRLSPPFRVMKTFYNMRFYKRFSSTSKPLGGSSSRGHLWRSNIGYFQVGNKYGDGRWENTSGLLLSPVVTLRHSSLCTWWGTTWTQLSDHDGFHEALFAPFFSRTVVTWWTVHVSISGSTTPTVSCSQSESSDTTACWVLHDLLNVIQISEQLPFDLALP